MIKQFSLTEKQAYAFLKLTDNTSTEIGYGGGAGSGKSILGVFWVLSMAIKYKGTAWLIGRRELTNLKKTTLLSFFLALEILGVKPEQLFVYNSQTNIFNFHNGSKIFLMDTSYQPSDPLYTRFGGLELTGAFIDESNETNIMAIEILKTRIGRRKNQEYGLIPKLLETFNPDKAHIYHRYYRPYKDKKLPKGRIFIPALATDNPYLDPNYIEQLKKADPITRERLLYGNFEYDDDPYKLFNYDKILDIFTNNAERGKRYCTIDVAGKGQDKTVIMIWDGLFIEKIIVKPNISSEELDTILVENNIPRSQCVADEDGVGFGLVKDTKGIKAFVNNSSPIKTKSEQRNKLQNYANLKSQCWFELAHYVENGMIGCYRQIDQEIKEMLIEELEQIKQIDADKDTPLRIISKDRIREQIGRSTDLSDAMMMRLFFQLRPKVITI